MKVYIARLPKWGQVAALTAILLVGLIAALAFMWLLASVSISKPISKMPWYFWPLTVTFFLMRWLTYVLPIPRHTPISEMSVGSALIRVVFVGFVTLTVIVSLVNGSAKGIDIYLFALFLPIGIRGAAALRLRLQGQRGTPALR